MKRLVRQTLNNFSFNVKKTTQLRNLIESEDLSFIMEAHSGLSAKIVEEAGFQGIWGSGLSISAQLGVRDSNEVSWTQVADVVEFMSDASSIPILLDGDTGFGNFNNARMLVKKLEKIDCAGVCIEDKLFPKTNSLLQGKTSSQKLADVKEFCGKIAACKVTQKDPDFVVVARLESFIAEQGLEDALFRAGCYADAGADAILVHSKKTDPSDIESFVEYFDYDIPVIIVPTKYYTTPTDHFRDLGINMVIWANHSMRSSMKAMKTAVDRIYREESLTSVEELMCVPISEVFRITDQEELTNCENIYLNYNFQGDRESPSGDQGKVGANNFRQSQIHYHGESKIVTPETRSETKRSSPDYVDMTEGQHYQIHPRAMYEEMRSYGTDFFTGVPDSLLKNFCNYMVDQVDEEDHVICANEGTAIGLASGHYMATGNIPVVYMQNSGLGNTINPITSLTSRETFCIPMLLLVGWRGEPFKRDEPQHKLQGRITPDLLDLCGIPNTILSEDMEEAKIQIAQAYKFMNENRTPYGIIVRKKTFSDYDISGKKLEMLEQANKEKQDLPIRISYIEQLLRNIDLENDVLVGSTGFPSRELYHMIEENDLSIPAFYMVGSMGHAGAIAAGVAVNQKDVNSDVYCLDGDGAVLMHLGGLATIAKMGLNNYTHVVIRNCAHESVGGQPLGVMDDVDFSEIARSVGFKHSARCETVSDFSETVEKFRGMDDGPKFIEARCRVGTVEGIGRPTKRMTDLKNDFMLGINMLKIRN